MERVAGKIAVLKKALESLGEVVADREESKLYEERRYRQYRDSLIQRFEYCTDLLWKVVKVYLEKEYGVIAAAAPKSVFREVLAAGLLDEAETRVFLEMIDARNMTSHLYHEEFAEALSKRVPGFYRSMGDLSSRLR